MINLKSAIARLDETGKIYIVDRAKYERLRVSHDSLLAAAKEAVDHCDAFDYRLEVSQYNALQAAIAAAEGEHD